MPRSWRKPGFSHLPLTPLGGPAQHREFRSPRLKPVHHRLNPSFHESREPTGCQSGTARRCSFVTAPGPMPKIGLCSKIFSALLCC